ncbi:DUF429 domain-containing protein [Kineococcus sp. T13]|uniref:DUF429 domain-containing protein n=1 Tax=Kineococcus vitellinus TaxID=2696565 RepID=UPI00141363DA|nr:DUF429 domain-containing protein [Kineococcus vitellinus]NAZ75235.1 DUF429 domain-containing protein [Kineococcus vitellinus]
MSSTTSDTGGPVFLGLDLAWSSGWTGLAVVDDTGRLIASGRARTDEQIITWIEQHTGQRSGQQARRVLVAAVDAPLIVPNERGQRAAEALIGRTFGGFGASAYSSNRTLLGPQPPRALRLAQHFGWAVDPATPTGGQQGVCLEVYPHPAMIGLFQLGYRLDYKKGTQARRVPGFAQLAGHLESVGVLRLRESPRWRQLRQVIAAPEAGDLDRIEDELDAVVCAHLAWLWQHQREALRVYGTATDGYIVAPPPPAHHPVRPAHPLTAGGASSPAEMSPAEMSPAGTANMFGDEASGERSSVLHRWVAGRPAGFASNHEQRWRARVAEAFTGCTLPATARLQVQADFVLAAAQSGANEPDLDNMIKSSIDALVDVIGERRLTGGVRQADDVRVDRIIAGKRFAGAAEEPGADITISVIT